VNIIEALVVTLKLDSAKYQEEMRKAQKSLEGFVGKEGEIERKREKDQGEQLRRQQEAERKASKEQERQLKTAAEGYSLVRNAILGMVGAVVSVAGVKSFFTANVDGLMAMKRASTDLGISIREVDAWGRAVATVGGNKEAILQTMQSIRGGIEAFETGLDPNSPVIRALGSMGILWKNASGGVRSMTDMLPEIANALQKYDPQKQLILAGQLGIDPATLQLLRKGGSEVRKLYEEQYAASRANDESAKSAERAKAEWAKFEGQLKSVGQIIFTALAPALEKFNVLLDRVARWLEAHQDEIAQFFSGLADLILNDLIPAVDALGSGVGAFVKNIAANKSDILLFFKTLLEVVSFINEKFESLNRLTDGWIKKITNALNPLTGGLSKLMSLFGRAGFEFVGGESAPAVAVAPASGAPAPAGGGPVSSDMRSRIDHAMRFFTSKGWTREQAAGIVANLKQESGLSSNPRGPNDGGAAFGVAQWHGDRQAMFRKVFGKDIRSATLEEQYAFVDWELRNSHARAGNMLRRASSAREAGAVASRYYESPAAADREAAIRGASALAISAGAAGAGQMLSSAGNSRAAAGSNSEVNIGQIYIQTSATDANGIAQSIRPAVNRHMAGVTALGMG